MVLLLAWFAFYLDRVKLCQQNLHLRRSEVQKERKKREPASGTVHTRQQVGSSELLLGLVQEYNLEKDEFGYQGACVSISAANSR